MNIVNELRRCSICEDEKDISSFYHKTSSLRKRTYYTHICIECAKVNRNAKTAKRRQDSIEKDFVWSKSDRLVSHNIQLDTYKEVLARQDFRCKICQTELDLTYKPKKHTSNSPAVDHDHKCCNGPRSCGKCFRGILCVKCNAGIGFMNDNPFALLNAAKYLLSGYDQTEVMEVSLEISNLYYSLELESL